MSYFATEYYGIYKIEIKLQLYLVGTVVKNPPADAGDVSSNPGSGSSPGRGNGNPHQYFCLENPMDRGAWQLQSTGSQRVRHNCMTERECVNIFSLHLNL